MRALAGLSAALIATVLVVAISRGPAGAGCGTSVYADAGADVFTSGAVANSCTDAQDHQDGPVAPAGNSLPPGHWVSTAVCESNRGSCDALRTCPDGSNMLQIWYETD